MFCVCVESRPLRKGFVFFLRRLGIFLVWLFVFWFWLLAFDFVFGFRHINIVFFVLVFLLESFYWCFLVWVLVFFVGSGLGCWLWLCFSLV